MAGKALKNNIYTGGTADIEMPPLGEMPSVLFDSAPQPQQPRQTIQDTEFEESAIAPIPESVSFNFDYTPKDAVQEPETQEPEQQEYIPDNPDNFEEEDEEYEEAEARPRQKESKANQRIRQLKEVAKKAERDRDEMMRMMQMQMQQQQQQQAQPEPEPEYEEPDLDLDDDGLAENRHIKAMHRDMKELKKQLKLQQEEAKRIQFQTQNAMVETRIKATLPDFDNVVSSKNIARLKAEYPEVAATLYSTADLYSKAVSTYTFIKNLGISRPKEIENDRLRAINNSNKPRPIVSIGPSRGRTSDSPLTRMNGFADGDSDVNARARALKEMNDARSKL